MDSLRLVGELDGKVRLELSDELRYHVDLERFKIAQRK